MTPADFLRALTVVATERLQHGEAVRIAGLGTLAIEGIDDEAESGQRVRVAFTEESEEADGQAADGLIDALSEMSKSTRSETESRLASFAGSARARLSVHGSVDLPGLGRLAGPVGAIRFHPGSDFSEAVDWQASSGAYVGQSGPPPRPVTPPVADTSEEPAPSPVDEASAAPPAPMPSDDPTWLPAAEAFGASEPVADSPGEHTDTHLEVPTTEDIGAAASSILPGTEAPPHGGTLEEARDPEGAFSPGQEAFSPGLEEFSPGEESALDLPAPVATGKEDFSPAQAAALDLPGPAAAGQTDAEATLDTAPAAGAAATRRHSKIPSARHRDRDGTGLPLPIILGAALVVIVVVAFAMFMRSGVEADPDARAGLIADSTALAQTDSTGALAESGVSADSAAFAETAAGVIGRSTALPQTTPSTPARTTPEATTPIAPDSRPSQGTDGRSEGDFDTSASGYTLIAGSTRSLSAARAGAEQLRELGLPVAVLGYSESGSTRYRIAAGQYASSAEADADRTRLQSRLPDGTWVRRIRP